ncbi:MAG: DUF2953 domain-containing protein [Clostridia bacterium]|nr:DUF2953 domain-containing protein [Clostridia bacterium]
MTALYIIGGIILFIVAIMMIRGEVVISYSDTLSVTVRVLGIPIRILPRKKKKIKISDYSPKKRAKILEKRKRDKAKADAKAAEKEARAKGQSTKRPLGETISLIKDIVSTAVKRFSKHLRVRVARLHVYVATGDAATTAILYGAISQTVAYIAALLDSTGTLRSPAKADVDIHADYLSEKTTADVEIGFSLRVWQIFDVLLRTLFAYVRHMK